MRALVAIVLSALLATCSSPPSLLDRIVRTGELTVVTRNTPASFYYGADEPRGIEYELARGYAERLGVRLRIYTADQVYPIARIRQGADCGGQPTVADARKDVVTFGPAYQTSNRRSIYRPAARSRATSPTCAAAGSRSSPIVARGAARQLRAEEPHAELDRGLHGERRGADPARRGRRDRLHDRGLASLRSAPALLSGPARRVQPRTREPARVGAAARRGFSAREHRRPTSPRSRLPASSTNPRSLLFRVARVRLRRLARVHHACEHAPAALPRLFPRGRASTGMDWRLLAAIAYQESHWNPGAVSPTGVRGMMMLTEHTAEMMEVDDRDDPHASIIGGAHYFARVLRKIPQRIGSRTVIGSPSRRTTWASAISRMHASSRSRSARIPTAGTRFASGCRCWATSNGTAACSAATPRGRPRSPTSTTSAATTRS